MVTHGNWEMLPRTSSSAGQELQRPRLCQDAAAHLFGWGKSTSFLSETGFLCLGEEVGIKTAQPEPSLPRPWIQTCPLTKSCSNSYFTRLLEEMEPAEKARQDQESPHEQGPAQGDCFPLPTCMDPSGKVGLGAV